MRVKNWYINFNANTIDGFFIHKTWDDKQGIEQVIKELKETLDKLELVKTRD